MTMTLDKSKEDVSSGHCRDVLISLRKITQAIDLHSRSLSKEYGLTSPQLAILQELSGVDGRSVTELGRSISLSQGTVTDIITRLEKKALVTKRKSSHDKRRTEIALTEQGRSILAKAPPPLQETFTSAFVNLAHWEQMMILSSLHRIVHMMSAKEYDGSTF